MSGDNMNGQAADLIRIDNLTKKFGDNTVLHNVSTHIKKGEKVVIIGPSGSGKSTLLRCMNLLETPTEGKVYFDGKDITDPNTDINAVRCQMGMVFQHFNLFPNMTVQRNITLAPVRTGRMTEDEAAAEAKKLMELVGLSDKADAYPASLSGGQKQRIAIAGILAMKPDCIVLDEPTAMLDPKGRREVMDTIHGLNEKEGITIVLITHFMEEAVTADHVMVVEKGELRMEGTPKEVFSQAEKLTAWGLDVPVAADLAHGLRKKGLSIPEDCMTDEELGEALCPYVSKM